MSLPRDAVRRSAAPVGVGLALQLGNPLGFSVPGLGVPGYGACIAGGGAWDPLYQRCLYRFGGIPHPSYGYGVRGIGVGQVGVGVLCPQGTMPVTSGAQAGQCVVTSATNCPAGYQYDGTQWCNPVGATGGGQVCPIGTTQQTVALTGQVYCQSNYVAPVTQSATCPQGYTLSSDQTNCLPTAAYTQSCPAGYVYNTSTLLCNPTGTTQGGTVCPNGYTGTPTSPTLNPTGCAIAAIPSTPISSQTSSLSAYNGNPISCAVYGGQYNADGTCTPLNSQSGLVNNTSSNTSQPTINPLTGAATCPTGMTLTNGVCVTASSWTTTETVATVAGVGVLAFLGYHYRRSLGFKG